MSAPKFCVNCVHHGLTSISGNRHQCNRPGKMDVDLVTGQAYEYHRECGYQRSPAYSGATCGPDGLYFFPKLGIDPGQSTQ